MKQKAAVALCLLAVLSLLCGCADGYPEGQTLTFTDMQITLPGDFMDLSQEEYSADADFLYGWKTLIVKGMAEKKADLQEMTLEKYTFLVIAGNDLQCTPERFGNGYRFTYTSMAGDAEYTYVTAAMEGDTNFWLFQFYCPSANIEENQTEIDIILSSIREIDP